MQEPIDFGADPAPSYQVTMYGGKFDGICFTHFYDPIERVGFFLSNVHGNKKFKHVFVPFEVEHPDFIG
jgi:hypothetical protein